MAARRKLLPAVVAFAFLASLVAGLPAQPVAAWDYTTPKIDYLAEEAMRLINLDRVGNGLSPLARDQKLINWARDLPYACPSNGSMILNGRARDMIDRNYFSHYISGCWKNSTTLYSSMDIMAVLGYTNFRGEIIAHNTYGVSATSYKYGCDVYGNNCDGTTTTPATVASDEAWWMNDASHRAIILGSFDRFACGKWIDSSGNKVIACDFAMGGPNPLDTTAPTVQNATGNGATVQQGSSITLSASVADNFRLSDGWAVLDPNSSCSGTTLYAWAYNLNVTAGTPSFVWNTGGVAVGAHVVGWRVRDVSTLMSACYTVQVTVTSSTPTTAPSATFTAPAATVTVSTANTTNTIGWTESSTSTITSRALREYWGPVVTPGTCVGVNWKFAWSVAFAANPSPFTISGFTPGYCYFWSVSLTNSAGQSGSGTSGYLLIQANPPSATFTYPAPGTTTPTGTSNTITWTENGGGSTITSRTLSEYYGAVVNAGACTGVTWKKAWSASLTSPLALAGFNPGYCYYWTVSLTNSTGLSSTATSGYLLIQ